MTEPKPPEELEPSSALLPEIASLLERSFRISTIIGVCGFLVSFILFVGYLCIGGILIAVGSPAAPTSLLSLQSDSGFYLSVTTVALFIVQATGSLLLYQFLTDVETERAQFVMLMSYIGLGFGAAALRFTLHQTIGYFLDVL